MRAAAEPLWTNAARAVAIVGLAAATGGCASLSYVDRDNNRHVVGLVNLKLAPETGRGGAMVTSTTLGLAVRSQGSGGAGLALGFNRDVLVSLPNAACLDLARPGPCAERAQAARGPSPAKEGRP